MIQPTQQPSSQPLDQPQPAATSLHPDIISQAEIFEEIVEQPTAENTSPSLMAPGGALSATANVNMAEVQHLMPDRLVGEDENYEYYYVYEEEEEGAG